MDSQQDPTPLNGFQALKKLKQTEESIEMLRRRFQVLRVKEEEARSKTIQHEHQIRAHYEVQRIRKEKRKSIDEAYQVFDGEVQTKRVRNKKQKKAIEIALKSVRESIEKEKKEINDTLRKQHFENEKRYEVIKAEDVKSKQQKRDIVIEIEKAQREKVERYHESRVKETLQSKSRDTSALISRAAEKEKELMEMAKMEQELARRSSDSVQVSQAMRSRLVSVLGQSHKKSMLPGIHSKSVVVREDTNSSSQL